MSLHHIADAALEQTMADLLAAEARIASLEADVEAYGALAVEGIHALHVVTAERDRLRASNRRLHEELRRYRSNKDIADNTSVEYGIVSGHQPISRRAA